MSKLKSAKEMRELAQSTSSYERLLTDVAEYIERRALEGCFDAPIVLGTVIDSDLELLKSELLNLGYTLDRGYYQDFGSYCLYGDDNQIFADEYVLIVFW
jgi:hypothetical protein